VAIIGIMETQLSCYKIRITNHRWNPLRDTICDLQISICQLKWRIHMII